MTKLTGTDVQNMITHWLQCPVNGYLGSSYGQDTKAMLQRPQQVTSTDANAYIAKLRDDVPVLHVLPANSVNLYGVTNKIDTLDIVLEVAGTAFNVSG